MVSPLTNWKHSLFLDHGFLTSAILDKPFWVCPLCDETVGASAAALVSESQIQDSSNHQPPHES